MKKKLFFILIPIFIILGSIGGAYYYVNKKIYVPTPVQNIFDSSEDQQESQYAEEHGIFNILLVGLDGREKDEGSRTDSIILATIDTNNKSLKLTSFMRDMYVPIANGEYNRINSAFAWGGPELLIKTINKDFNLSVQYYVSIDFNAFQELVDKLGGVDVNVKDYEVKEINKYIAEVNGSNATLLKGPGLQHLNGQQALSYSRIRKVGNGDYERTERQRTILSLLVDKAKKENILKLPDLFASILPYIKTNIPGSKLMSLGYTVYKFGNTTVESQRIPADGAFQTMNINGMDVLVPNMQKNVSILQKFIFSTDGTLASNMPVYMVNNFHLNDIPIDNRGQKLNIVKIVIPEQPKTQPTTPSSQTGSDQSGTPTDPNGGGQTGTGTTPPPNTGGPTDPGTPPTTSP